MVRISWYSNRYRLMSIVISFRKCSRYRIRLRILSWMVVDLSTIHHSALSIGRADSWVPSISDVFADDWEEV